MDKKLHRRVVTCSPQAKVGCCKGLSLPLSCSLFPLAILTCSCYLSPHLMSPTTPQHNTSTAKLAGFLCETAAFSQLKHAKTSPRKAVHASILGWETKHGYTIHHTQTHTHKCKRTCRQVLSSLTETEGNCHWVSLLWQSGEAPLHSFSRWR